MRKPVNVVTIDEGTDTVLAVVCDDGAVFISGPNGWTESTPVPGTQRETEVAG